MELLDKVTYHSESCHFRVDMLEYLGYLGKLILCEVT
jgi:hypothetical protein